MTKLRPIASLVRELQPAIKENAWIENTVWGNPVQPQRLPKPACKVWLVCGPPASGKSTYVKAHAQHGDIVIDLDTIAREYGFTRDRPRDATAMLLMDRNDRLAALAKEPPNRVAWAIIGAPSKELRQWWCDVLGVTPERMILLKPHRAELYQRIEKDPDRRSVQHLHKRLVDKWFVQDG